ncbi:MAG: hypothetical protein M3P85_07365 [Actinomycetota bacterium]|nr:hypothetical protein [Actinomycetota bacterium]
MATRLAAHGFGDRHDRGVSTAKSELGVLLDEGRHAPPGARGEVLDSKGALEDGGVEGRLGGRTRLASIR